MTAHLTRRRATALIHRRLAQIGQPAAYFAPAALDELIARSGDTEAGLLAALSATLFLAATEEAPRVEVAHVEQAVAASEPVRLSVSDTRRHPAALLTLLAAGLIATAASLMLLLTPGRRHSPELPPPRAATAPRHDRLPAPPHVALPSPAGLPEIFVRTPPVPPARGSAQLAAALPSGPPARVTLMVTGPGFASRHGLSGLAGRLRNAGIDEVRLQSIAPNGIFRPHYVIYFFTQDLRLAARVAGLLDSAEFGGAPGKPWEPLLVLTPAGRVPHAPGNVEADIP